jgi:hypothetical protein
MLVSLEEHTIPVTLLEQQSIPIEFYKVHVELLIFLYNNKRLAQNIYNIVETRSSYIHNWISNTAISYIIVSKGIKNDQQERHIGSNIGGADIREVPESEVKREEEV